MADPNPLRALRCRLLPVTLSEWKDWVSRSVAEGAVNTMTSEDKINSLVGQAIEKAEPLVDQVIEKAESLVEKAEVKADSLVEKVKEKAEPVVAKARDKAGPLLSKADGNSDTSSA